MRTPVRTVNQAWRTPPAMSSVSPMYSFTLPRCELLSLQNGYQFEPFSAASERDGLNESNSLRIKFVVDRTGLQRGELLSLKTVFEGAKGNVDRLIQRKDRGHIFGDSDGELLLVGIANVRIGLHDNPRLGAVHTGLP